MFRFETDTSLKNLDGMSLWIDIMRIWTKLKLQMESESMIRSSPGPDLQRTNPQELTQRISTPL